MQKQGKTELAAEIVNRYIDIYKRTGISHTKQFIASVLLSENGDLYKDLEDARYFVRKVTHTSGSSARKRMPKFTDLASEFALMASPAQELTNPEPFVIPELYKKAIIIADVHSRFYSKPALEAAINNGIKHNCKCVIIDGDFMDFYQFSKFDKNPRIVQYFEEERDLAIDILTLLQNNFGKVFLKKGNHDIRREQYVQRLSATMPELMDLTDYSDYLFYEGSNTEIIEDYRHIQFGKLNIIHGHEYQGGGGIHIAWNRLNKAFDNILSAHSHRSQSVTRQDINKDFIGSWTIGCMCDLNPRYSPKNDWTNGFAIVERDDSGMFEVHNKIVANNRLFSA